MIHAKGMPAPVPTPREIARRSAEVRSTWTAKQHYDRAGLDVPKWTAPTVHVPAELVERLGD